MNPQEPHHKEEEDKHIGTVLLDLSENANNELTNTATNTTNQQQTTLNNNTLTKIEKPSTSSSTANTSSSSNDNEDDDNENIKINKSISSFSIEYIFLAEFDIDKGSIIRISYPNIYPYESESYLASLMLPDGSHNCVEDTTVFFLRGKRKHHNNKEEEEDKEEIKDEIKEKNKELFYHVLNVQKQKKYEGIRRSSRVKSLAIVSKERIIYSLRDILSKYLDIIFNICDYSNNLENNNNNNVDIELNSFLKNIFYSLNNNENILIKYPNLLERKVLRYCIVKNKNMYYNLKVPLLINKEMIINKEDKQEDNKEDNKIEETVTIPKCLLENEIQYQIRGITQISLCRLVNVFKEQTMLIYNAILYEKRIIFFSSQQLAGQVVNFVLSTLEMFPEMYGLLKKRCFPYASLSNLDEFSLVRGYIIGVCNPMFTSREEFYDLLVDIDKSEVKVNQSYELMHKQLQKEEKKKKKKKNKNLNNNNIMDVKNQYLQQESNLFDYFVNDTFDIIDNISNKYLGNRTYDDICYFTENDLKFIRNVLEFLQFRSPTASSFEMIEDLLRSHFYFYTKSIIELAFDEEKQILFQQQQLSSNAGIEVTENIKKALAWRNTSFFKEYKSKYMVPKQLYIDSKQIDIFKEIQILKTKTLQEEELITLFQALLKNVNTRDQIIEFLSYFPEIEGGLQSIAICALHSSELLRILSVTFLKRLETVEEGKLLVHNLNLFLLLSYDRISREI
ncbi:hypothetical protein ABK040_009560 [Willaertia magna]